MSKRIKARLVRRAKALGYVIDGGSIFLRGIFVANLSTGEWISSGRGFKALRRELEAHAASLPPKGQKLVRLEGKRVRVTLTPAL